MSELPTKPGYYWAMANAKGFDWEIVRVSDDQVYVIDDEGLYFASDFTFCPEVTKPEWLE